MSAQQSEQVRALLERRELPPHGATDFYGMYLMHDVVLLADCIHGLYGVTTARARASRIESIEAIFARLKDAWEGQLTAASFEAVVEAVRRANSYFVLRATTDSAQKSVRAAMRATKVTGRSKHLAAARAALDNVPPGLLTAEHEQLLAPIREELRDAASPRNAEAPSVSISFSVRDMSQYHRLNREATQAKGHDWSRAVALLREAKSLEGDHYCDTRLAKFLQEAGRFDEALAEIQWLLDRVHVRLSPNVSGSKRARLRARVMADIHRDAALICGREGRADLAAEHERREQALLEIVGKLDALQRGCVL